MKETANIIFMATSRSGLGHIRRTASVAIALKARRPDLSIALFTNAEIAGLPESDLAAFDRTVLAERAQMAELANALQPHVIVADTMAPEGISRSPAARVIILREMPQDRLQRLALPDGASWDLVLVPNPQSHWMPELGDEFARSISATGWIYRKAQRQILKPRKTPLLLIATGGGGTAETASAVARDASRIVTLCKTICPRVFEVVQALGPRTPENATVCGVDRVIDPGGDLNQYFADADAVIRTADDNSAL